MQYLQCGESGFVLEDIAFNLSDSIADQRSAKNERIEDLGMRTFLSNFHSSFVHQLLQVLKLREVLEIIRFNGGNLVIVQISTDIYDMIGMLVSEEEKRDCNW